MAKGPEVRVSIDGTEGAAETGRVRPAMTGRGDNPIQTSAQDALGRASAARAFANHVLALDAGDGLVFGVLGSWGSGKTSFINMARADLGTGASAVLDFNPWMFSGTQQLVDSFFVELAAQMQLSPGLGAIGKDLEEYGESFSGLGWLPIIGAWIERGRGASKAAGKLLQRRKEGTGGRRVKLSKALGTLPKPIVVVLDDIDRLETAEIRDVFKLVRLTASFPNLIYIVAFDRARVESALSEQGVPGRDYLEKILQVAVDLPNVPAHVLSQQIFDALDHALADAAVAETLDQGVWSDVFIDIIRPLIRNMRDVTRYAASIRGTVEALGDGVALADLLALEAIRVFLPDVFARLHDAVDGLTEASLIGYGGSRERPDLKAQVEDLVAGAGRHRQVVERTVARLFPAGARHLGGSHYGGEWKGQWLAGRRVAHEDILRFYLEGIEGDSLLAFTDAESAWARMTDPDEFDTYLRGLAPERLEDVIASLEVYEHQFGEAHVVPGVVVLLNVLSLLPEREGGMFTLDRRMVVGRVVYRLLRKLDPDAAEMAVLQILPSLGSLSAKLQLIGIVGHRENVGHGLVSEDESARLERAWRDEVRAASAEQLLTEDELLRVLVVARREAGPDETPLTLPDRADLTLAALRSARSEVKSQSMGSSAIHRSSRLAWDALVEIFGEASILRHRIAKLAGSKPQGDQALLELAERYASGWRPPEF